MIPAVSPPNRQLPVVPTPHARRRFSQIAPHMSACVYECRRFHLAKTMGRRAGSPSYSQNPTLAHTGCHRISSQSMDAALQQLMSMGAAAAKASPARTVPTLFWSPTDADINQAA